MKTPGFTLIELLIVIAIIALLAAILFPVFSRARENARRASCQSNLKQIGMAFTQYSQDYDERIPYWSYTYLQGVSTRTQYWDETIYPYVKSIEVFRCPSAPATIGTSWRMYATDGQPSAQVQYAVNTLNPQNINSGTGAPFYYNSNKGQNPRLHIFGEGGGTLNYNVPTIVQYESPSETIWSFCADVTGNTGWNTGYGLHNPLSATTTVAKRHFDGSNYLFADGHVKWYQPSSVNKKWWTIIKSGWWTSQSPDVKE
jgi:prepilin-type N-terminal cleavage/methylation domain-containing protein/prepilin-type processing-associated H-X9-DG protein